MRPRSPGPHSASMNSCTGTISDAVVLPTVARIVARHGFWQWAVGRAMNTDPVDNRIDIYYSDINSVVNN